MESFADIQTRLTNIRSVLPILNALRTISLGRWQAAQKQRRGQQHYEAGLLAMTPWLLPYLQTGRSAESNNFTQAGQVAVLVIGSERGLCGRFNAVLVKQVQQYLNRQAQQEKQVKLMALGNRLVRLLQQQYELTWFQPLPKAASSLVRLAFLLTQRWLADYEAYQWDAIDLIYNAYQGIGRYQPATIQLIPPSLPVVDSPDELHLPPIIETDPFHLYEHIIEQWIALKLYGVLLESAIAEHSARYQLMEAANQNAERLIEELTVAVQTARRQAITQETQALAVGAGLLESRLA